MDNPKPIIGITAGDPAGIGPELCLMSAAKPEVRAICRPVVYGCRFVLERVRDALGIELDIAALPSPQHIPNDDETVRVIETGGASASENADRVEPGHAEALTGKLAFDAVSRAIDDALASKISAIVTAPIQKAAWHSAGIEYAGHTELLAKRTGTDKFCMLMTSPRISCALVTTHIGISKVAQELSKPRVLEVIRLTHAALRQMRDREPRLVVLGLNPHAGEAGLFGDREEERVIVPAVEEAKADGMHVTGPVPADTAFVPAKLEVTDGYICMYHDQGLIPFKSLAFGVGVNVTLGLPIVRTSVDHGTALDIAWQGKADDTSLIAAVEMAVALAADRADGRGATKASRHR